MTSLAAGILSAWQTEFQRVDACDKGGGQRNFCHRRGELTDMKRLEAKHPRAIRWFHWINFPLISLMMWSGMLIYWAHSIYRVGIGNFTLFHFFPNWFYETFDFKQRLAEGMAWHFAIAWLFAINGLAYVAYTAISGEWRYLIPNRNSLREAIQVTLYDLRLSKKHPPRRKFNGAQQIAYSSIVVMGAGSLVTGLAIWKSAQFAWLTAALGGYPAARLEHFLLTLGYAAFFLVHISQVIRAGWNNLRAMIAGYEVVEEEQAWSATR
jgi:thiosulfate reductase cytochrome b subunit